MPTSHRHPECPAPPSAQAFVSALAFERAYGPSAPGPLPIFARATGAGQETCLDETTQVEEHKGIRATRNDGFVYPGDLLVDAVRYRSLRAQSMRGRISGEEADELAILESRLRQAPPAQDPNADALLRAFQRYNCDFPALVSFHETAANGSAIPRALEVDVRDISAGGIKAVAPHSFSPGESATLSVVIAGLDHALVRFPARVAWITPDAFGLMFAGQAEIRPASESASDHRVAAPRAA
jgi:hypothetical protein